MKYLSFLFFVLFSSAAFAECTRTEYPDGERVSCWNEDLMIYIKHTDNENMPVQMGFENKKGEIVIPAIWDSVSSFTDDLAAVSKDFKWGYINKQGQVIIPVEYDNAQVFWQGKAKVEKNCQSFHIDKQGRQIDEPKEISGCIPENVMHNPENLKKWLEKQSL